MTEPTTMAEPELYGNRSTNDVVVSLVRSNFTAIEGNPTCVESIYQNSFEDKKELEEERKKKWLTELEHIEEDTLVA